MFPHVFPICSPFNKFAYHLSPPSIPSRKKKKRKKEKKKDTKKNLQKESVDFMWRSIRVTHHLKHLSKIHNPSAWDEH